MDQDNLIQWPRAKYWDKAWNPVVGCNPCSPACENCYAAAWAKRFGQSFVPHRTKQRPPRRGVVFCGNMTDLFAEWVDEDDLSENISMTLSCYVHRATYLWLTKRVDRMCNAIAHGQAMLKDDTEEGCDLYPFRDCIMRNQFFGFTAENQEWYDRRREPIYHKWPYWANLWLSCEPLLGAIDDMEIGNVVAGSRLKWVVVGCESGPNRRPCKIEWVESIVDQCRSAKIPVFVKQLDIGGKCEHDIDKFPAHLRIRQVPWA